MPALRKLIAPLVFIAILHACTDDHVSPPRSERPALIAQVRRLAQEHDFTPIQGAPPVRPALVRLGQALAFDKILSGNRDIACMSCHLPELATGDGRAIPVGSGAAGLGPDREHPDGDRTLRHSPPLFNLHLTRKFLWDGRVEVLDNGTIRTPAGDQVTPEMENVFEFGPLSVQPLFPVEVREEMRGPGNELADVPDGNFADLWSRLMDRLGTIREYRDLFEAAYPATDFDDMNFAHASNAIAGFMASAFTFTETPWDRFLGGDDNQLTSAALRGAKAFMTVGCTNCHETPQFDGAPGNEFHNDGLAQFGPGVGDGPSGRDDFGRERVTGDPTDRRRFVTRPLRNIELTAPYGHVGQFATLKSFVEHYDDVDARLLEYDIAANVADAALWPTLLVNFNDILANRDTLLLSIRFDEETAVDIVEFLHALTDEDARDLSGVIPDRVPSGLAIDRMR